jgi:hypothetical protein
MSRISRIPRYSNYVAALERFLDPPQPEPPAPPKPPRRGRRKALGTVRDQGHLLRTIAEINTRNPTCRSDRAIARRLHKRPGYAHLSTDQLRRDVAVTLRPFTELIPLECSRTELRKHVLDFIRRRWARYLQRNN